MLPSVLVPSGKNKTGIWSFSRSLMVAATFSALARLDHGEAQVDEATRRVSLSVEPGTDRLMAAIHSLERAGIEIDDIAVRQPKLDEVFLTLTGQPLHDGTDAAPTRGAA